MASAFSLFGELKLDDSGFRSGLKANEAALKAFASTVDAVESKTAAFGKMLSRLGDSLTSIGTSMTVAVTAPIVALGTAATTSAVSFDTLRTRLAAAVGGTEAANAKFDELNRLAQQNAGVMTSSAIATYAFLKPLGLTESTIQDTIKAFGKLKSANPTVDLDRMAANLGQLFDQGFEMQDVKELLGNFPRAGEILQKVFGLSGSDRSTVAEEMRNMLKGGLTKEDFFAAFAGGVNTDSFLSNITDPVAVRFEKMKERIMLALEPLGVLILSMLERVTPYLVSFAQTVSSAFTALSPTMQVVVVAIAAIAAAIGPAVIAFGAFVGAIGAIVGAAPVLGIIAAAIAGIGIALSPLLVLGPLFYSVWASNWELVKQVFQAGYEAVSAVISSLTEFLAGLWEQHGTGVMAYLSAWWTALVQFIGGVAGVLGNILTVALNVIQGNWSGAWQAILALVENVWKFIVQVIGNALSVTWKLLQAYFPVFIQGMKWAFGTLLTLVGKAIANVVYFVATLPSQLIALVPKLVAAGLEIGAAIRRGIWEGIQSFFTGGGGDAAVAPASPVDMFSGLIESFKNAFTGSMPEGPASTPTFLSSVNTDAIKTKANLENVSKAVDKVKTKVAAPVVPKISNITKAANAVKAAVRMNGVLEATMSGFRNGKGEALGDVRIRSVDTLLSNPKQSSADAMAAAVAQAIKDTAPENKLKIEIDDPSRRTSIGGTSENVNARYKN